MNRKLIEGPILKSLISFTIPVLIAGILQLLYNMVDSIVIGRFLGSDPLGSVRTTSSIAFLIVGFTIGISNGFSVIVAQRFGAKDEKGVKSAISTSILLSLIIGIILTVVAVLISPSLLHAINVPADLYDMSYSYIVIIYAGIIASVFYNLIAAILRALGNSVVPLIILGISATLNVILDLVFIGVLGFGVWSAALATVISQCISAIICFIYSFKKYPILRIGLKHFKEITLKESWNQLKVGLPMAIMFSITSISVIVVQGTLNEMSYIVADGKSHVTAFGNATNVEQFINQPLIAIGVSLSAFCGQNYGAKQFDRIKKGIFYAVSISLIYSVIAMFIVYFFGKNINYIFLSEEELNDDILRLSTQYLQIVCWFIPFLALIFTFRNTVQSIGDPLTPAIGAALELVARIVFCIILSKNLDDPFLGVCLASPIAWVSAGLLLSTRIIIFLVKGKSDPYFVIDDLKEEIAVE